jgi:hypothetical protein
MNIRKLHLDKIANICNQRVSKTMFDLCMHVGFMLCDLVILFLIAWECSGGLE